MQLTDDQLTLLRSYTVPGFATRRVKKFSSDARALVKQGFLVARGKPPWSGVLIITDKGKAFIRSVKAAGEV